MIILRLVIIPMSFSSVNFQFITFCFLAEIISRWMTLPFVLFNLFFVCLFVSFFPLEDCSELFWRRSRCTCQNKHNKYRSFFVIKCVLGILLVLMEMVNSFCSVWVHVLLHRMGIFLFKTDTRDGNLFHVYLLLYMFFNLEMPN